LASFAICPPIRCCAAQLDRPSQVCGARAYWQTPRRPGELPVYRCHVHREPGDLALGRVLIYRQISLAARVIFAGASQVRSLAREEAVARLDDAVSQAGGLLQLLDVSEAAGRYEAPAPGTGGRPRRGQGVG
jgi:hypothetical protein